MFKSLAQKATHCMIPFRQHSGKGKTAEEQITSVVVTKTAKGYEETLRSDGTVLCFN